VNNNRNFVSEVSESYIKATEEMGNQPIKKLPENTNNHRAKFLGMTTPVALIAKVTVGNKVMVE
jgi:hypothetical protein